MLKGHHGGSFELIFTKLINPVSLYRFVMTLLKWYESKNLWIWTSWTPHGSISDFNSYLLQLKLATAPSILSPLDNSLNLCSSRDRLDLLKAKQQTIIKSQNHYEFWFPSEVSVNINIRLWKIRQHYQLFRFRTTMINAASDHAERKRVHLYSTYSSPTLYLIWSFP